MGSLAERDLFVACCARHGLVAKRNDLAGVLGR
jgi:hypothetical protein